MLMQRIEIFRDLRKQFYSIRGIDLMVWLVGNNGMLGTDVEDLLIKEKLDYMASDIEVDITDKDRLHRYSNGKNINCIINCSAYTEVDSAEDNRDMAFKINAEGVKNLAEIALARNAKLIHISTDYVFDGSKADPYDENDLPNPIGIYGKSKLAGERKIEEVIKDYFIIRTSWLYGKKGKNFVSTMLKLFMEKDEVRVVNDQVGTPTYTKDLAKLIIHIVKSESEEYGIYHFSNGGACTWFEFASRIYSQACSGKLLNNKVNLVPIKSKDYPTKVMRPKNSLLSKNKIMRVYGMSIPLWEDGLHRYLNDL